MDGKCARCTNDTGITIMSMFNRQEICLDCKDKETKHPRYEEARSRETQAVTDGNYNFGGIGLPKELR